jgi:predicted nucleic acid-binding protein
MKVVVSDTSSISNLIIIGKLDILKITYAQVIIPPEVKKEILALKEFGEDVSDFLNASWIEMIAPDIYELQLLESYKLDQGEKEAIALARFINADLLVIDEKAGRAVAKKLGIKTTGLLGTIVAAKKLDKTISVKQVMDELIQKAGFWISKDLYREVLKLVEEG